jgi:hypothetical protein
MDTAQNSEQGHTEEISTNSVEEDKFNLSFIICSYEADLVPWEESKEYGKKLWKCNQTS